MTANVTMGTRVMVQRATTSTNVHFFYTIVQNIQVVSMKSHSLSVTVARVTQNKVIFVLILTSAVASMRFGCTFFIQFYFYRRSHMRVQLIKVPS